MLAISQNSELEQLKRLPLNSDEKNCKTKRSKM